jgi:2-dehydro-3-deoxygluconokinase
MKEARNRIVTFGDIMMRLSSPGHARFTQADTFKVLYAGSEANVACSLSNFGMESEHVTRFPDNDFGVAATQALRRHGVITKHIVYGGERIGVYFLENGAIHRASRIIYDRYDSAFAHIDAGMIDWKAILRNASWFHWSGITPALSQGAADVCMEAIVEARKQGATISGDINYRRNLWKYGKTAREVMPEFVRLTDRLVGGVTDFENCFGIKARSFESACKVVKKTFPSVKKIGSTLRESISASHNRISGMLWNGKEVLHSKKYDLTHIVDRVGAGDAFMAGLIYSWQQEKKDQAAVDFAAAACALKHTIEGDVNLATVEEVDSLVRGENIGKLLR